MTRLVRSIPLAALLLVSAAACSNTADGVKQDASNAAEKTAEAGAEAGSAMSGGAKTMDVKAALLGSSVTVPIRDGRLRLGTWQGIYLCEHRDRGGPRSLVITLTGE
jgi:secondary thiamine-phosphate synthase enzyme